MRFGGISTWVYTVTEYEKSSVKHNALIMSMLTVLMLFFMVKPGDYLDSDNKKEQNLLHAAGYAGMVYAALQSTDGYIRPKYSHVTIFDEFGIMAGYVCLWCLMGILFGEVAVFLLFVSFCFMFSVFMAFGNRDRNNNDFQLRDKQTDFIAALSTNDSPAAVNSLTTVALFALLTNPEDPTTKAIVEAARTKINAPPPPADDTHCCGICG